MHHRRRACVTCTDRRAVAARSTRDRAEVGPVSGIGGHEHALQSARAGVPGALCVRSNACRSARNIARFARERREHRDDCDYDTQTRHRHLTNTPGAVTAAFRRSRRRAGRHDPNSSRRFLRLRRRTRLRLAMFRVLHPDRATRPPRRFRTIRPRAPRTRPRPAPIARRRAPQNGHDFSVILQWRRHFLHGVSCIQRKRYAFSISRNSSKCGADKRAS